MVCYKAAYAQKKKNNKLTDLTGFEPDANGSAEKKTQKKTNVSSLHANFLPRKTAYGLVMCRRRRRRKGNNGINRTRTWSWR